MKTPQRLIKMIYILPEKYKENKRNITKLNEKGYVYNKINRFIDKTIFGVQNIPNKKPVININKILIPDNWRYKKFRIKLELIEDKKENQNALQI